MSISNSNHDPYGTRDRARLGARSRTVSIKRISMRFIERETKELDALNAVDPLPAKPKTLGECHSRGLGTLENPCAYLSCKWNLALDVDLRTGSIKMNFPEAEDGGAVDVREIGETCSLRVADRDGLTLEEVGAIMNLTRERVRQIETKGLERIAALAALAAMQEDPDDTHRAALVVHEELRRMGRDVTRNIEPEPECTPGCLKNAVAIGRVFDKKETAPGSGRWTVGDASPFYSAKHIDDVAEEFDEEPAAVITDPADLAALCVTETVREKGALR